MNNRKMQNAEFLFDSMGMIDDKIIAEAESPIKARAVISSRRKQTALWAVAAMLAIVITGGSFRFLMGLQFSPDKKDEIKDDQNQGVDQPYLSDLDQILQSAAKDTPALSKEEIDLFDGSMKIVWKEAEKDVYHSLAVTGSGHQSTLRNAMNTKSPEKVQSEPECSLWICYPDGTVVSPYLENTPGNVGYGNLFSYSAEVMPTDHFTDIVNNLLN